MNAFERLSLVAAVVLGLASLFVSGLSWRESQAANDLVRTTGRPYVRVTAARVRFPPTVGDDVTIDIKLENIGARDASGLTTTMYVTGRPQAIRMPNRPMRSQRFDDIVPPSGSLWLTANTYNAWLEDDVADDLSIGGFVRYTDTLTESDFKDTFCFSTSPGGSQPPEPTVGLSECSAIPTIESMRRFLQ